MSEIRLLAVAAIGLGFLLAGMAAVPAGGAVLTAGLAAARLRCEHRENPIGIDLSTPRLSWEVTSSARGVVQSAYQIVAGEDSAAVAKGEGAVWDTGRVSSDQTIDIAYAGQALRPHQRVYWSVRVWDSAGKASDWATPAQFTAGFVGDAKWPGAWVGFDAPRAAMEAQTGLLDGASWIGFAKDDPADVPQGDRFYAKSFDLPRGATVQTAKLCVTADDHFFYYINGQKVGESAGEDAWRNVATIDVSKNLKIGRNDLRVRVDNVKPGNAGLLCRLIVTLGDGKNVEVVTDASWSATDEPANDNDQAATPAWACDPNAAAGWPGVKVIGENGVGPWGKLGEAANFLPPAVELRKTFDLTKPVRRAVLYMTALGIADAYLNGQRVSDDRFNPGWTDYAKRVYYRGYDVSDRLKQGRNAMGAILADGWYSGYVGYGHVRDSYGKNPRYSAVLHIDYADGTAQTIQTDKSWTAAASPTSEADLLMGERHDARQDDPRPQQDGWATSAFDAAGWSPVDVGGQAVNPLVQWHPSQPVTTFETFKPRKITEPTPGVYVLDLGQNFAGVVRLMLTDTTPGQAITLRYAERLSPDGAIYTANLRAARATDTYLCRGGSQETWEPRFTFHGFQYVEVTGLKSPPTPETITAVAVGSATPIVGTFETSDAMLNQLRSNIYYTQRANFIDIPTDCPQRDERLGWTADAQVYLNAAILMADVQPFFDKWLVDLADAQRADGQFPRVAPMKPGEDDGGPAWADAGVICPWVVYQAYGDKQMLARQYPSMRKFIDFCAERSGPHLKPPAQFHAFGDWLNIDDPTPKDVIYLLYFGYSTDLCAKAARALGNDQEADELQALFVRIRESFNESFVARDGRIKGDSQAGYVMAIAYHLVEGPMREAAGRRLIEKIEARDNHLSTGFLGTKELMLVLSDIGRVDKAFTLVHNTTFPSWGFTIKNGATSIWERWDGWTPEKGFQTPIMNSFAHYSFGAVYQWMAENIGGIHASTGAARTMVIRPQIDPKLQWAAVTYHSPRGLIVSKWSIDAGRLILDVTVPANTRATIGVPTRGGAVTESGKALEQADGVKIRSHSDAGVEVEVGSGSYHFETDWPTKQ